MVFLLIVQSQGKTTVIQIPTANKTKAKHMCIRKIFLREENNADPKVIPITTAKIILAKPSIAILTFPSIKICYLSLIKKPPVWQSFILKNLALRIGHELCVEMKGETFY